MTSIRTAMPNILKAGTPEKFPEKRLDLIDWIHLYSNLYKGIFTIKQSRPEGQDPLLFHIIWKGDLGPFGTVNVCQRLDQISDHAAFFSSMQWKDCLFDMTDFQV